MPDEQGPPTVFGIDTLTREVRLLKQDVHRHSEQLAATLGTRLEAVEGALCSLDRGLERNQEAVMADLNSLKDALDAQGQTIQQEAQEVKSQLDQLQATIDELKQNANDPAKVQELADEIQTNTDAVRTIFTGDVQPPPPTGRRK